MGSPVADSAQANKPSAHESKTGEAPPDYQPPVRRVWGSPMPDLARLEGYPEERSLRALLGGRDTVSLESSLTNAALLFRHGSWVCFSFR
jgi:hypothetical protein